MTVNSVNYNKFSKIFSRIMEEQSNIDDIIDIYNYWIKVRLPKKIEEKQIIINNRTQIKFRNVKVILSNYSEKVKSPADVLKHNGTTYLAEVRADIVKYVGEKEQDSRSNHVLARFPAMLGSDICVLNNKTPEEIIALGECPADPLGYFRINSTEKALVTQELLRVSQVYVFMGKDGKLDCRTTVPCRNGTVVTNLHLNENLQTINVQHSFSYKKNHIPLFFIYTILGQDVEQAVGNILKFILPENQTKAYIFLLSSIQDLERIRNSSPEEIGEPDDILSKVYKEVAKIREGVDLPATDNAGIKAEIKSNLFPNVSTEEEICEHLSHMVAQLVNYMIGVRPLDDRDSWSNKRLESAGRHMEKLFNIMWDSIIESNISSSVTEENLSLIQFTNNEMIQNTFISAFSPGNWGIKRAPKKENFSNNVERNTNLTMFPQITRVVAPVSKKIKNPKVRGVESSQYGIVDPSESPDGDVIGLVKNLSIATHISAERDPKKIIPLIEQSEYFSKEYVSEEFTYPIFLEGTLRGWCSTEHYREFELEMKTHRRSGRIEKDVCILWNSTCNQIEMFCNSSRPTRPVFIVNQETNRLVIDEIEEQNPGFIESFLERQLTFEDLIKTGCVEYLDPREQEYSIVAMSPRHFYIYKQNKENRYPKMREILQQKLDQPNLTSSEILEIKTHIRWIDWSLSDMPQYTHCSIDPAEIFSIMSSLAPKANHEQGPRVAFQAGMNKQALSMFHSNHHSRFDAGFKLMLEPCRSIFEVQTADMAYLNTMPAGTNVVTAFLADPSNQEDGIILNQDSTSKFKLVKYFTFKILVTRGNTNEPAEEIRMPEVMADQRERYHALDPKTGLPIIGKYVKAKDYILGKVRKDDYGDLKNASISISNTDEGVIDSVRIEQNSTRWIVSIKMRNIRVYSEGDKAASRYSQKGVINEVRPSSEMPVVVGGPNDGVVPDIIVNPHSIPSRMTMGWLMECVSTKAAVYMGQRIDASSFYALFNNDEIDEKNQNIRTVQEELQDDMEIVRQVLIKNGMYPDGTEIMAYQDGSLIQTPVSVCIDKKYLLKHHAKDKAQGRGSEGVVQMQTLQPGGGRAKGGGIRYGEMEQNSSASHGASSTLQACLMWDSDPYNLVLCANCGIPPTYTHRMGNAPPNYQCKRCHGYNFCTVAFPFTTTYLMKILSPLGIEMALDVKMLSEIDKHLI